jgi:hypothetical protein
MYVHTFCLSLCLFVRLCLLSTSLFLFSLSLCLCVVYLSVCLLLFVHTFCFSVCLFVRLCLYFSSSISPPFYAFSICLFVGMSESTFLYLSLCLVVYLKKNISNFMPLDLLLLCRYVWSHRGTWVQNLVSKNQRPVKKELRQPGSFRYWKCCKTS